MRPVDVARCSGCGSWQPLSGDRYCSLCRHELFDTLCIYVDREKRAPVTEVFAVRSRDARRPSDYRFDAEPWMQLSVRDFNVGRRETHVDLKVDPQQMGMLPRSGFVTVSDGTGIVQEIKVTAYPAPRSVTVKDVDIYLGADTAVLHFTSDCALDADVQFEVKPPRRLDISPSEQPVKLVKGKSPVPVLVSPRERGEVVVSFRLSRGTGTGRLVLSGAFKAQVKRPPTIAFPDGLIQSFDTYPDDRGGMTLRVRNDGDDPLRISSVLLECANAEASWTYELASGDVAPGGLAEVRLTARTTDRAHGSIPVKVGFVSDARNKPTCTVKARIIDDEYDDYLAVDYGTSTSAVALLVRGTPVNLPLDGPEIKVVSDVYFRDFKKEWVPPYVFTIGQEAALLGKASGGEKCYVRAVKPRVGTGRREPVVLYGDSHGIPSEDVAQFAVMELLRLTRRKLHKRPTRLIFTVPTRFTLHQRDVLKDVFAKAARAKGLDIGDPDVVDESLAAGVYYLFCGARQDQTISTRREYTLLVMDFGGGTTDVTLFRVHQEKQEGGVCVRPESVGVLGAWGDQSLGGESLTDRLSTYLGELGADRSTENAEALKLAVSEVMKPSQAELSGKRSPPFVLDAVRSPVAPGQSPSVSVVVARDDSLLRSCLQTLDPRTNASSLTKTEYESRLGLIRKDRAIQVKTEGLANPVYASVDDVLSRAREWLKGFENEMDLFMRKSKVPQADRLLLCGQASLLPVIPETFSRFAAAADYVRDEDGEPILKECVSLGAAIHAGLSADQVQVLGEKCWWRRVGRLGGTRTGARGPLAFTELVPWGARYGEEFRPEKPGLRVRRIDGKSVLELVLLENLSLSDTPDTEHYRTYLLQHDVSSAEGIPVILELTDRGELEAYCEIGGQRMKMEVKTRGGQQ